MQPEILEPSSVPNYRTKRINYALAATLLCSGVDPAAIPAQVGAKNLNSLRVGLQKRGVTLTATKALPPAKIVVQRAAVNIAQAAADEIRDRLNKDLLRQSALLSEAPLSYRKLASKGQGHAAMTKTVAEAFRSINGGADMNVLVFGVSSMESPVQQTIIDVPCVPDPDAHPSQ